jgi:hypothetical protein
MTALDYEIQKALFCQSLDMERLYRKHQEELVSIFKKHFVTPKIPATLGQKTIAKLVAGQSLSTTFVVSKNDESKKFDNVDRNGGSKNFDSVNHNDGSKDDVANGLQQKASTPITSQNEVFQFQESYFAGKLKVTHKS